MRILSARKVFSGWAFYSCWGALSLPDGSKVC